jgi:uncharacterized membrane protein (Fun14 family)
MPEFGSLMGPLAGLGFGGLAGAAVGYAAKKMTKLLALLLGLLFIAIQLLAYNGFLQVDWAALQTSAEQAVNSEDGRGLAERAWQMLTSNLPWSGGFVAGFAIGFKLG